MKKWGIIIVLLAGILALSCASVWGQKGWKFAKPGIKSSAVESGQMSRSQVDRYALHFWDGEDVALLGTRLMSSDGQVALGAETQMADFFSVLLAATPDTARKAVNYLLDKAMLRSAENPSYQCIMEIAEKYFYSVQSPYYCEEMLLPFLDHKIARTDIPEIEKSREKYLALMIRRNSVGSRAENFTFNLIHLPEQPLFTNVPDQLLLKNGDTHKPVSLFEIVDIYHITTSICDTDPNGNNHKRTLISKPLMLVFYSASCRDCRDGIGRLSHSPMVRERVSSGKMNVLVVCVERNCSSSFSQMPKDWIVAEDTSEEYHKNIVEKSLYSVRQTPSVYLLDEKGVVLLKDADVSSAIQFLLDQ